jgi:hypothetical protein
MMHTDVAGKRGKIAETYSVEVHKYYYKLHKAPESMEQEEEQKQNIEIKQ